jgi:hypothetical protein
VWDQAFRYHLEAAGSRTPARNLRKVISTLGDRDLPLALAGVAAGLAVTVGVGRRRPRAGRPVRDGDPGGSPTAAVRNPLGLPLVAGWLLATVLVLAAEHPLWRNHVSHLVPAAAVLVAAGFDRLRATSAGRRSAAVIAGCLMAVAVPYHVVHLSEVLWPAPPGKALAAARADLRALPARAEVISDDPGVVWRAGRRTPDDLVDTSILRIESRRLTAPALAQASVTGAVCAVLVWSHRFGDLSTLPRLLGDHGYRPSARYGGPRVLYTRAGCSV